MLSSSVLYGVICAAMNIIIFSMCDVNTYIDANIIFFVCVHGVRIVWYIIFSVCVHKDSSYIVLSTLNTGT